MEPNLVAEIDALRPLPSPISKFVLAMSRYRDNEDEPIPFSVVSDIIVNRGVASPFFVEGNLFKLDFSAFKIFSDPFF